MLESENESSESTESTVLFLIPLTHLPITFDSIFWLPLLSSDDRKASTSLGLRRAFLMLPISASVKPMESSLCLFKYLGLSPRFDCDRASLGAMFARCIFQVLEMSVAASRLCVMNRRKVRMTTTQALLLSLCSRRILTKSPANSSDESSSQMVMAIPWLNSPVTAVN